MTTFTIEIPDNNSSLLSELLKLTKNAGIKVRIDNDGDNLRVSLKTHYFKLNKVFCDFFEFSLLATFSFLHHLNT